MSMGAAKWALVVGGVVMGIALAALFVTGPTDPCAADASAEAGTVRLHLDTYRYQYALAGEESGDAPISVPMGSNVVLCVTSTDVTHGFAIDGYPVSEEIPAGQTIAIRFVADKAGDFTIYCTVFCGPGHPQHKGTLHVA